MDANFRLKNQLVSTYLQDPGLEIGMAYMLPHEQYESYVLDQANDGVVGTCHVRVTAEGSMRKTRLQRMCCTVVGHSVLFRRWREH
jgi:hypothetical protein